LFFNHNHLAIFKDSSSLTMKDLYFQLKWQCGRFQNVNYL
jgi:hypothetical protein